VSVLDFSPMPADCLSDLTIDRLLAGELDGRPARDAATAHLATCTRCRARHAEIAAEAPRTPSAALVAAAQRSLARQRRRRGPALAAFVSALAVAAVVVVAVRPMSRSPIRLKGGDFGLEVLVRRADGRAEATHQDLPLHAGDVVGFRVRTPSDGHLAIVSIDDGGRISEYLPGPTATPPAVKAGESMIDVAITLDATAGRETLFAVLCPDRDGATRAASAAAAVLARAGNPGAVTRLDLPCLQARAVIVKEASK
jgi:hypothetical protein